jgi:AmmeMemoRadiSam system protein B
MDAIPVKPSDELRGLSDNLGYATTAEQMDSVLTQSKALAAPRTKELMSEKGLDPDTPFAAAVCPHDDYYYASRLYALIAPHIQAKTVILFGVFHKASAFDISDKIVFDSFKSWRGPYGPVSVSPLREELISRLPAEDYVVDNDAQMVEHSVEGIVPWLQAYDHEVEIVPILVPYMDWKTMDHISQSLSKALTQIMKAKGWSLGKDVAIIASSDAVHYGDQGWGGNNFAEFGTDIEGYAKAVDRDRTLAEAELTGQVDRNRLKQFLYTCVDKKDVTQYKLSWCGRFSVPFGLDVASRVSETLASHPLTGTLLDYGTSVAETSLDLDEILGLGATAPNNLHHWVGYVAIGYR